MTDAATLARPVIARHEGCRLKPYVDTVGKITIGYGRNLTDRGITQGLAELWFDEDLGACLATLETYPWFGALTAVRQMVLIDLVFNVGPAGFAKFVRLRKALGAGDYHAAAAEILDSQLAPRRRAELVQWMRTGQRISI